jgi:hypothetical protein
MGRERKSTIFLSKAEGLKAGNMGTIASLAYRYCARHDEFTPGTFQIIGLPATVPFILRRNMAGNNPWIDTRQARTGAVLYVCMYACIVSKVIELFLVFPLDGWRIETRSGGRGGGERESRDEEPTSHREKAKTRRFRYCPAQRGKATQELRKAQGFLA